MLNPENNCFRQGEAELRASEHGIVYLYLAFEANGPLRLIKAKKGRYSVLSPANNCVRRGEAELRISKPGLLQARSPSGGARIHPRSGCFLVVHILINQVCHELLLI